MRILPIFNFSNNINFSKVSSNNIASSSLAPLQKDTVSFGKNNNYFVKDARELTDLPCACCGHKMTQNSLVNKFLNEKIYFPAYQALTLMPKEGFVLREQSREILNAYEFLLAVSKKYKNLSVQELLTLDPVKSCRKHLSEKENLAFDEICEKSKMIAHNSFYMIKAIESLNPAFQSTEKSAFNELKTLSMFYPEETFYDILNKPEIKSQYLRNLKQKQMNILQEIKVLSEELPRRYQFAVDDCIKNSIEVFTQEHESIIHKRKRVIEMFEVALDRIKTNKTVKQILEKINNLPNSETDIDAFMIKSSQKTSNSLAETLVTRTRSTREHVVPKHRVGDKGENSKSNYIYLCAKCNQGRKMTEYSIFVEDHPEMIKNTQRQVNTMIRYINNGILVGYDTWPEDIKKALNKESGGSEKKKGKINIDISRLNKTVAEQSREGRIRDFVEKARSKRKKNRS